MSSKYFVLSCVLLQGLVVIASETPRVSLNKSNSDLRRSRGDLSKSQEVVRPSHTSRAATFYYESPCSNRLHNPRKEMIPMDPWRSDCP